MLFGLHTKELGLLEQIKRFLPFLPGLAGWGGSFPLIGESNAHLSGVIGEIPDAVQRLLDFC